MTAERPFYIYCHTAPNGKRYIGQTCQSLNARWSHGHGYRDQTHFKNAIEKYGWENFRHDIICVVHSEKLAHLFERYYIQKYDTFNHDKGYNLTLGGEGTLGHELSEEAKRKISEANTGNFWDEERKRQWSKSNTGEGNPMYGHNHSDESRRKMSENARGRRMSAEERAEKKRLILEAVERQKKPVKQYDLEGNCIATFASAADAGRSLGKKGVMITRCCRGQSDFAYGYRWSYANEELRELTYKVRKARKPTGRAVIQFDLSGNEVARYTSSADAARQTGLCRDRIGDCCHGGLESYGGYVWEFANHGNKKTDSTAVIQLDLDGNELQRFDSLADASSATGVPRYLIRNCCRGLAKTSQGFKWMFVDGSRKPPRQHVAVAQLDMDCNEVARYKSLSAAARETGCDRHRITECCDGKRDSYRGTKWMYVEAA